MTTKLIGVCDTLPAGTAPEFENVRAEVRSHKRLNSWGSIFGRVVAWLLAPVVVLISALYIPFILASSNEFPIWRQKRVGYRGRDLWVPKFSTMNADASGALRETWFGRIVRPVGLDEILQIFLIARGEMQWFGPRPFLRPHLSADYINYVLHHTKPGFINSRSLATGIGNRALQDGKVSIPEMIRYDLQDLSNWSFWYAARLLSQTLLMILRITRI
jgi:lipopolysaccharide/colanic/teichoic acid biosynthesis glycosyltransferase